MPLQERLLEDLRDAMRQRDDLRRSTLRLIRAAIQNEEIARHEPLDDARIIDILSRIARQHQESITEFLKGNRPDLVEREEAELAIVRQYLPQPLTGQELAELARLAIDEVGATGPAELGKVMGRLMPQVRGRADGAEARQVVSELLES
ncbi:MAG: GatB/YqeY domain-containing protein [Dehalococcoidia bacterium]